MKLKVIIQTSYMAALFLRSVAWSETEVIVSKIVLRSSYKRGADTLQLLE